ncbi:MAG: NUDIX hydrolase [Magnetococcales bacterium]|nr:NUDIX hydrolase [Magnetococcales bacterium]MBF0584453.1 NUDIX hydrolase [Magnetococcales bacterium]
MITTPLIAADILIEMVDRPDRPIVLIERQNPPYGWAVPGGFMEVGERLERTAIREAAEETSLAVTLKALLGIYSAPGRDPRFHAVTAVYVAEATGTPKAADDAKNIRLVTMDALPTQLAFDHDLVFADYRAFRENGSVAPLREGDE